MRNISASRSDGRRSRLSNVHHSVGTIVNLGAPTATAAVVATLGAAWAVSYVLGGAQYAPHWFYVPILVAAARFRVVGAAAVAVCSMVLAGPLLPFDAAAGTAQSTEDWLIRGGFFVGIGIIAAVIVDRSAVPLAEHRRTERLQQDLRHAVDAGDQFTLVFQPLVSLADTKPVGVEVFLRWTHPFHGPVPPAEFIPLAEDAGFSLDVDRLVLERVCRDVAEWRTRGLFPEDWTVFVNISAAQCGDEAFLDTLRAVVDGCNIRPGHLCLEITETALISDFSAARSWAEAIKAMGVAVAIDDFGTGHASVEWLAHLPVDVIKIDKSFVDTVTDGGSNRDLVPALVALAHHLGATAVAEGVETKSQAEFLVRVGCDNAQGYLYSVPLTDENLHEFAGNAAGLN